MSARHLGLASCLFFLSSCVCGTGADTHEYFCSASEECGPGFHCDLAASVCVIGEAGSDAGEDAGLDAGHDAGAADAGEDAGKDAGLDAGGANGASCLMDSHCLNGRCVDGRCCNSSCANACDSCDLPGREGQCRTAPLGHAPFPACAGGYACNGSSAGCPTSCSADAGCLTARCGSGGVCVEKLETLQDDFNAATIDRTKWSSASPSCSIVNSRLHAVTTPGVATFASIHSARRYDLTDSELRLDLVNMGNQSLSSMQAVAVVCDFFDQTRCLEMIIGTGEVFIQLDNASTYMGIIGYFPMNGPRAVRMRERAGTLFLDAKSDAGVWTQLGSTLTPFINSFRDVTVDVGAGTYDPEPSASTVIWDNVNLP